MRLLADIRLAFAMLTILPGPRGESVPTPRVTPWFPWVGGALGLMTVLALAGIDALNTVGGDGDLFSRAALPLAVIVVAGQAVAARLLHHDGLADVADAWWSGPGFRRRLEIMADSSTGAFGTTAVVLVILAHASATAAVLASGEPIWLLGVIPVFGRASAMFGAWLNQPARSEGLGSLVIGSPKLWGLLIGVSAVLIAVIVAFVVYGRPGALWAAASVFVALTVQHRIAERFGGHTGDTLGASVLLTEAICLLFAAAWVTW